MSLNVPLLNSHPITSRHNPYDNYRGLLFSGTYHILLQLLVDEHIHGGVDHLIETPSRLLHTFTCAWGGVHDVLFADVCLTWLDHFFVLLNYADILPICVFDHRKQTSRSSQAKSPSRVWEGGYWAVSGLLGESPAWQVLATLLFLRCCRCKPECVWWCLAGGIEAGCVFWNWIHCNQRIHWWIDLCARLVELSCSAMEQRTNSSSPLKDLPVGVWFLFKSNHTSHWMDEVLWYPFHAGLRRPINLCCFRWSNATLQNLKAKDCGANKSEGLADVGGIENVPLPSVLLGAARALWFQDVPQATIQGLFRAPSLQLKILKKWKDSLGWELVKGHWVEVHCVVRLHTKEMLYPHLIPVWKSDVSSSKKTTLLLLWIYIHWVGGGGGGIYLDAR